MVLQIFGRQDQKRRGYFSEAELTRKLLESEAEPLHSTFAIVVAVVISAMQSHSKTEGSNLQRSLEPCCSLG